MARTKRLVQGRRGSKTVGSKAPRKAPATKSVPAKRKRRFKPGSKLINIKISINTNFNTAVALREIKKYQKSTELLIPFAPFARLVKETMDTVSMGRFGRIQHTALKALQEATEAMLVNEFESTFILILLIFILIFLSLVTNIAAIHAKRVTIQQKDMHLVQKMRLGLLGYSKAGER
jgi:histone H3